MNALLSQALVTVAREYEQRGAGSASLPTLAVWSNVLRPIGNGIDLRQLPAAGATVQAGGSRRSRRR